MAALPQNDKKPMNDGHGLVETLSDFTKLVLTYSQISKQFWGTLLINQKYS